MLSEGLSLINSVKQGQDIMDTYFLIGEDVDGNTELIAERRLEVSIETERCKEAIASYYRNLRIVFLTEGGNHDNRGGLTRAEWTAINA